MSIHSLLRRMGAEIGLLLLCLFLFFFRLGDIPLIDYDEALYVSCAQQMVISGDWVTPRLNTRMPERPGVTQIAFFEKPILVYWVSAASMRLFGRNMWAARLPVALVGLVTTLTIYLIGRRWFGRRVGLLAALVYATCPITLVNARQMTTDGLLVLTLTLALLCFWELGGAGNSSQNETTESGLPAPILAGCFWLVSALAVLTKGIVGMLLPFMIIFLYLVLDRVLFRLRVRDPQGARLRFALKLRPLRTLWSALVRLKPVSGLLLFLICAVPWHYLILHGADLDAQGRTWVQEYLLRQHVGRFRGLDAVHNQPLPTYIVYFLLGFFPWACFVPTAFLQAGRIGNRHSRANHLSYSGSNSSLDSEASGSRQRHPVPFLLVWFCTIFTFFSLSAAKLPTYISPAYPAAALLLGYWLDGVLPGRMRRATPELAQPLEASPTEQTETFTNPFTHPSTNPLEEREENGLFGRICLSEDIWLRMGMTLRRGAAVACWVGILLFVAALFAPSRTSTNVLLPVALINFARHLALLFAFGSGVAWICFRMRRSDGRERTWGVAALTLMMVFVIALTSTEGYSAVRDEVFAPYQSLARDARQDVETGIPVVYYHVVPRRPSMLFYAGYAPFEHKETPLLPFLASCLTPSQREADIITTGQSFDTQLGQEIKSVPGATLRLMQRRGPVDGWVLARIYLPTSYVPPPVQHTKEGLWTPVSY